MVKVEIVVHCIKKITPGQQSAKLYLNSSRRSRNSCIIKLTNPSLYVWNTWRGTCCTCNKETCWYHCHGYTSYHTPWDRLFHPSSSPYSISPDPYWRFYWSNSTAHFQTARVAEGTLSYETKCHKKKTYKNINKGLIFKFFWHFLNPTVPLCFFIIITTVNLIVRKKRPKSYILTIQCYTQAEKHAGTLLLWNQDKIQSLFFSLCEPQKLREKIVTWLAFCKALHLYRELSLFTTYTILKELTLNLHSVSSIKSTSSTDFYTQKYKKKQKSDLLFSLKLN